MTEEEIQKRADEGLKLFADQTPERREWLVKRFRDMNARCKKRTFEEWRAEESAIDAFFLEVEFGKRPRPSDETLRRLWNRKAAISNFLYNGEGPEPEWPWKAPEELG